ncbi:MAG: lytic transglycosylase domain-containing protein [Thermodesulfobacteriota bacterium]|jgi:soluble lytic murein transglycosylase
MRRAVVCILGVALWLAAPADSRAEIFTYKDGRGRVFYTNIPVGAPYHPMIFRVSRGGQRSSIKPGNPADFEHHVQAAASRYDLDPHLIRAVIKVESNYDHLAVSEKGARGLMQLMPATAAEMNVYNLFDPRENIMGGACYLKQLLGRFNYNLPLTIAAYNAGPGAVERCGGIPNYEETQRYVRSVLLHYRKLSAAAPSGRSWHLAAN